MAGLPRARDADRSVRSGVRRCGQIQSKRYFKSDQFFAVSASPQAQMTAAMMNIHE